MCSQLRIQCIASQEVVAAPSQFANTIIYEPGYGDKILWQIRIGDYYLFVYYFLHLIDLELNSNQRPLIADW